MFSTLKRWIAWLIAWFKSYFKRDTVMSALSITPPFPTFAGKDGLPLEDGYIWLGSANLNPQTNPVVAYWDETLTQVAQQPIRTLGGYPAYSGTPARLFISAAVYSILVQDKNGNTVYTSPSNTGPSTFVNFSVSEEVQVATAGQTVFTLANTYSPGTNSLTVYVDGVNQYDGAQYSFVETSGDTVTFTSGLHVGALVKFSTAIQLSGGVADSSQVTYLPAGTGAVTTNVQTKLRETVSVKDFGAVGDGVTDDTAAIQAAIDAVPNKARIVIPPGIYSVSYGALNFTRRESITFTSGSSRDSAVLQANAVAASASTPLVDISGCYQLIFEGITFSGVTASGIGAYIHRPLTGADKVSTGIQFDNCQFNQFGVGAQIGRLDLVESNNEDIHFNNCEFRFCTIGYRQYYQNALQNSITNGYMINNGTAIHLGGAGYQTGSLLLTNTNFAVTTVADIYFELPCYLEVNQCRSENSPQFIKSSGGFRSTSFPQITLIGVTIIAQTSAVLPMIDCRTMGFIAIGCQFGSYVSDPPAFINLSTYLQKATLIGCSFNAPITYGLNTSTWTGTIKTLGGNDGIGQFLLSGCYEWSSSLGGYIPVADANLQWPGYYAITTATPDVTQSNVWLVNNQTAPFTVTAFTAFENQKFSIANSLSSTQTTTIENNSVIRTKSGANTILVSGMSFVNISGVCYEV